MIYNIFIFIFSFYMKYLVFSYSGDSRELKRIIVAILKSWWAKKVVKLNYWHSFLLQWKNIQKDEVKLLLISTDNEEKLLNFLSQNFSQIERVIVS